MSRLPRANVYNFPGSIVIAGRKLKLQYRDIDAWNYLRRVGDCIHYCRAQELPTALMRRRDEFREVVRLSPIAGLVACLGSADPAVQRLAVWLLGKCHKKWAVPFIALLSDSRYAEVRKEV